MKKFKRYAIFLVMIMAAVLFTACSNIDNTSEDKTKAKTGEKQTPNKEMKKEEAKKAAEDIWMKYKGINAVDTGLKGIKVTLADVAVSDKVEAEEDGKTVSKSVVAVHMLVENTTADKVFNVYPDQATLTTSTGEQVEIDMWESDDIGGEINEGVIKEGDIFFYLERGHAEEINWIKLTFSGDYTDPSGDYDKDIYYDYAMKVNLKLKTEEN
jgi:hypothetical protein